MSEFLEALAKLATAPWQKKLAYGIFVLFLLGSALTALREVSGFTFRELFSSAPAPLGSEARGEIQKRLRQALADGTLSVDESHELQAFVAGIGGDGKLAENYLAEAQSRILRASQEIHQGSELAARGNFSEARVHFREAISLDGENSAGWANFGGAALELGDWQEAESSLRKALALEPQSLIANFNLGACLAAQEQPAAALEHLERAATRVARDGSRHQIAALRAELLSSRHFASIRQTSRFRELLRRVS